MVWDPVTTQAAQTGSLPGPRAHALAATLADGRVLVVAGFDHTTNAEQPLPPQVWDPPTGRFTPFAIDTRIAYFEELTLLDDGTVVVIGRTQDGCECMELWDPVSATAAPGGALPSGSLANSVTKLDDGRLLVTATTEDGRPAAAFTWDRTTRAFGPAGSLPVARSQFSATRLPDGRVLFAGGAAGVDTADAAAGADIWNTSGTADAEIWDPHTGAFTATGSLTQSRVDAPAALAGDGRVLVVGGQDVRKGEGSLIFSAEVFAFR